VKNAPVAIKKFSGLLKKLGDVKPMEFPSADDPIAVLVMSFLLWESTTEKSLAAYARIMEQVVDFNDLRVCMPHETVEYIGPRYPQALDRAQRLRAVLRNVYLREHAVNLTKLQGSGKREARKYIESLEGIVPFVSSRLALLSFETHVIPVDDQLRTLLIEAEVSDNSVENAELGSWLAAHVKAGDGPATHAALQHWVDEQVGSPASTERKPVSKPKGPVKRSKATA